MSRTLAVGKAEENTVSHDEMLRIYESPKGHVFLRFANKCFVRLDRRKGTIFFLATPDDADEWAANTVIKKWKLKRVQTINITREQEVEAAILTHGLERGKARRFVAAARRMAQGITRTLQNSIKIHMHSPNGETVTQYERGRLVTRKVDDILDAEIIDG